MTRRLTSLVLHRTYDLTRDQKGAKWKESPFVFLHGWMLEEVKSEWLSKRWRENLGWFENNSAISAWMIVTFIVLVPIMLQGGRGMDWGEPTTIFATFHGSRGEFMPELGMKYDQIRLENGGITYKLWEFITWTITITDLRVDCENLLPSVESLPGTYARSWGERVSVAWWKIHIESNRKSTLPETNSEFTPEKWWLGDDLFLLGFCQFSGAKC